MAASILESCRTSGIRQIYTDLLPGISVLRANYLIRYPHDPALILNPALGGYYSKTIELTFGSMRRR